ncbi:zinc finger MYM-type protein 1-like [Hydra vulgaris]|uniref:Zinc finger MYM-type protein 1-like n=1 Tax=Hydra vulgaris TaxID=6087 RepID=A0ABM4CLM2_HYDVU
MWNDGIKDNWRKLGEKIKSRQCKAQHRNHYIVWKSAFETLKNQTGIDSELEKSIKSEASKWYEILRCVLDVKLQLALRNLSFRGSSNMLDEYDTGNFLATLELLGKHNKTLQFHLEEVSRHQKQGTRMQAHYLSWRTQNEFIMACGETVFAAIIEEVLTAIYFSIIVDETPDLSHTDQITFVLQIVRLGSDNQWIVKERFLKVENLEKKKGSDIAKLIIHVLDQSRIDLKSCRGQGYDNGANMSGVYKGV